MCLFNSIYLFLYIYDGNKRNTFIPSLANITKNKNIMKNIYLLLTICLLSTITNAQWSQKGADIDGEAAEDQSGFRTGMSMSADGNTIAIGAHKNDGLALDASANYCICTIIKSPIE